MVTWDKSSLRRHEMRTASQHRAPIMGEHAFTPVSPATSVQTRAGEHAGQEVVQARVQSFEIKVEPVAAPRMTRRDKWLKPRRNCVQRYFDYRDQLQIHVGDIPMVPDEIHLRFHISMPDSWSRKKRIAMGGKPHRQRPDKDNLEKGVLDALFLEDGGIWRGSQEKFWTESGLGKVELKMVWHKN